MYVNDITESFWLAPANIISGFLNLIILGLNSIVYVFLFRVL